MLEEVRMIVVWRNVERRIVKGVDRSSGARLCYVKEVDNKFAANHCRLKEVDRKSAVRGCRWKESSIASRIHCRVFVALETELGSIVAVRQPAVSRRNIEVGKAVTEADIDSFEHLGS
jgi:hypothetical protein